LTAGRGLKSLPMTTARATPLGMESMPMSLASSRMLARSSRWPWLVVK
jgi:hypothetical protein